MIREQVSLGRFVVRWLLYCVPLAILIGSVCASFLYFLQWVTDERVANPSLLFLLPFAGVIITALYRWKGRESEGGSELIFDVIHTPGAGIPAVMTPLIYVGTLITQLFGGSVGREGPAVQMGGSIASFVADKLRLSPNDARLMMMAGVAAGFGAIFGTPLAGAVFSLEVLAIGSLSYDGLIPSLIASVVGDLTCRLWGIHQERHLISLRLNPRLTEFGIFKIEWLMLGKVALAAILIGLLSAAFSRSVHKVHSLFSQKVKNPYFRPVVGGLIIIGLTLALGTNSYLGLGIHSNDPHMITIESAFREGGAGVLSWFWKFIYTIVTLGSGFKGGEVTPMFFVGATFGNLLAHLFNAPVDLFAAIGLVAIFAGASNTPLASILMSVELFGGDLIIYFALACFLSYLFSGHTGVYRTQKLVVPKGVALIEVEEDEENEPLPHA